MREVDATAVRGRHLRDVNKGLVLTACSEGGAVLQYGLVDTHPYEGIGESALMHSPTHASTDAPKHEPKLVGMCAQKRVSCTHPDNTP
jgi:hypothetical protein